MKQLLCLIITISTSYLSAQQFVPHWQRQEATGGSNDAYTPLVLVDSFHHIIHCGTTYSPGPATGFVTFKYDQNGQKLWERRHQTSATDFITAAATDATGAVYVGGVTINDIFGGAGNQIIFKYSPEGDTLWQYYLKVEEGVTSSIRNFLLDEAQNLLIFGSYFDTLQDRGGLFVQKKAPDGTLLWTATHVESDYGYGASNAIRVGDRWVFWGRNSSSSAGGTRLLCWQIDANGQTLQTAASELNPEIIYPLHIDAGGNLFLTKGAIYKIVKYDTTAVKAWEYVKPSMFTPQGQMNAITTDKYLNIYSVGYTRIDLMHTTDITTKLDATGTLLWEHNLSDTNLTAGRCCWLRDGLLLTSGVVYTNPDSNLYDCCFALYDTDGFKQGGISDLIGRRNQITSMAPDGDYFYVAGYSDKVYALSDTGKLFVCKYSLEDFVNTINTRETLPAQPMSVIPNPVKGRCNLQFDHTGASREGVLQISNAQGVVVFSQALALVLGPQTISLTSFAHFPTGVYQVSILTNDRVYSAKVVHSP